MCAMQRVTLAAAASIELVPRAMVEYDQRKAQKSAFESLDETRNT